MNAYGRRGFPISSLPLLLVTERETGGKGLPRGMSLRCSSHKQQAIPFNGEGS